MRFLNDTYVKNISVLFSGNVFAQVIPFALAPIITRLFSPEELGVQGNFIALVTLISIIANGRLELAIILPKQEKIAIQLLSIGLKISFIVAVLTLSLWLFKDPIEEFYGTILLTRYLPYVSIAVFSISTHNLLIQWFVREKKYKVISVTKILLSALTNGSFILLGYYNYGVDGLVFAYIGAFFLTTVILYFISKKELSFKLGKVKPDFDLLKDYKDFPLINSAHAFSDILFSDFIILAVVTNQFGLVSAGIFVMMIKYLKAPTRFIGGAIGQVFYPEANQKYLSRLPTVDLVQKSLMIATIVAIPLVVVIVSFGVPLFEWYLGSNWQEVGVYARIMIIPIAFGLLTSPISSIPLIYNQQKKSFFINLIGMIIGAILFYVVSVSTDSLTYALFTLAIVQTALYLYLLTWYFKLSKS